MGMEGRARGRSASGPDELLRLSEEIVRCRRCPRLVEWRERVAREKRAAFADQSYWGAPVPGFGDPDARLLVVGLAPAAHGANRTGRMFTGDRSGDWLYGALHRAGLANQAESRSLDDGLTLSDTFITASVRCAPPANRPQPSERRSCRPYLEREFELLTEIRVVVALGGYAWSQVLRVAKGRGWSVPSPRPPFGHGTETSLGRPDGTPIGAIASYHPSQQNTFTGVLTETMFDSIWLRARELVRAPS
jgi:uracil-DNA glycosylase family 4